MLSAADTAVDQFARTFSSENRDGLGHWYPRPAEVKTSATRPQPAAKKRPYTSQLRCASHSVAATAVGSGRSGGEFVADVLGTASNVLTRTPASYASEARARLIPASAAVATSSASPVALP